MSFFALTSLLAPAIAVAFAGCGGKGGTGRQGSPGTAAAHESPELASNDGAIIVNDHAIIRQGAVGPLRVNEWRRPVMSFVYVVSARAGRDSEAIIVVRGIGKDTVTLALSNDTLRRILVTRPGARTMDGIQVGTPFATIANRPDATTAIRGTARVASLKGMCGVRFATDSAALSPDSIVKTASRGADTIRAIGVEPCPPPSTATGRSINPG